MSEHIPVFLASDDKFAPFVAITIVSAMENTKSNVDFFVLDSGLSEESKTKIINSAKKYPNCYIEFIDVDKANFAQLPESESYVSKATYNRFLISELKPNLNKAIYSDVDVIFLGDINELYQESLGGQIIGVVHDAIYLLYENLNDFQNRLNLPQSHKYFYAGLLLIDTEKWRNEDITNKLMQIGIDNSDKIKQGDQDILNMYFGSNYKLLSTKYEATNGYILNAEQFDKTIINDLNHIIIRHFESAEKPWNSKTFQCKRMPHFKHFWKYAQKTDFYSSLFKEYKKAIIKKSIRIKLFSIITFLSIYFETDAIYCKLFNIPFIKVRLYPNKYKVYLFGFLPLIKIKRN